MSTPKQLVVAVFALAYAFQQPSGGWVVFSNKKAPDGGKVLGQGRNPNAAWQDAAIQLDHHKPAPTPEPTTPAIAETPKEAPRMITLRRDRTPWTNGATPSSIPAKEKARRRAKNKAARASRKRNRRAS